MTAPVDENGRVVVSEVRKLMNSNTVLLVGSAPTFPQSVIDPIEELAALAKEHGCGMHVDACLGGYILPFFAKLGYVKEKFDFTLEGVTAMSADLHKFGFGPKQVRCDTRHLRALTSVSRERHSSRVSFCTARASCASTSFTPTAIGPAAFTRRRRSRAAARVERLRRAGRRSSRSAKKATSRKPRCAALSLAAAVAHRSIVR